MNEVNKTTGDDGSAAILNGEETQTVIRVEDLTQFFPAGITIFNTLHHVSFVNKTIAKMTGLPAEGFYLPEFIRLIPAYHGLTMEKIDLVFKCGESIHFPEVGLCKFWYELFLVPLYHGGVIVGALLALRDITKEKEIEKVRTDFLTLASHQLRTPLSGTKWLIETLQRGKIGPLTKKQQEYLNDIYLSNERMIKLVFDMLNVLRLESGGDAIVKKETAPVSDLCDELSLMVGVAAQGKKVIFRNVLEGRKTIVLETDMTLLQSVLESLLSNAINYSMPDQEIILDVKEKTNEVIFFVKDSGIGIPKEEQKRIFEKFYRASNAKLVKPDGTGLGLYIASMLAEKIGAEILFDSEEGKGSTFYLRVPKELGIRH